MLYKYKLLEIKLHEIFRLVFFAWRESIPVASVTCRCFINYSIATSHGGLGLLAPITVIHKMY